MAPFDEKRWSELRSRATTLPRLYGEEYKPLQMSSRIVAKSLLTRVPAARGREVVPSGAMQP
jgi:hypothetical protein